MAMNPMQKKARTSFLLGMLLTLVITGLIIGFLIFQIAKMKQEEAKIVYKQVYVVNNNIASGGEVINNVSLKTVDSAFAPINSITSLDFGTYITDNSTSKIALQPGTILTPDMINTDGKSVTDDLRLQEYNMISLPTHLSQGEYVDIRLMLPSGENFIVLSKKYIEDVNSDTIWIKVSEDEILTISNAIVEAYIMKGSLLYATSYTDAGMQNEATPTYIVKNSVISLMNSDPNITTTAKVALRDRYQALSNQRDALNQSLNNYNDSAISNIESSLEEHVQKQQAARQAYIDSLGL